MERFILFKLKLKLWKIYSDSEHTISVFIFKSLHLCKWSHDVLLSHIGLYSKGSLHCRQSCFTVLSSISANPLRFCFFELQSRMKSPVHMICVQIGSPVTGLLSTVYCTNLPPCLYPIGTILTQLYRTTDFKVSFNTFQSYISKFLRWNKNQFYIWSRTHLNSFMMMITMLMMTMTVRHTENIWIKIYRYYWNIFFYHAPIFCMVNKSWYVLWVKMSTGPSYKIGTTVGQLWPKFDRQPIKTFLSNFYKTP
jgi:hypothetical protein